MKINGFYKHNKMTDNLLSSSSTTTILTNLSPLVFTTSTSTTTSTTTKISLVKKSLKIVVVQILKGDDVLINDSTNKRNIKWFKEKGGDGKWITLKISLIPPNDNILELYTNNKFFFEIMLFYELDKKNPIENQSILRIDDLDTLVIQNKNSTEVKVRIEDISRKHNHQNFTIRVSIKKILDQFNNNITHTYNIKSVFCPSIEVLSRPPKKRNIDDVITEEQNTKRTKNTIDSDEENINDEQPFCLNNNIINNYIGIDEQIKNVENNLSNKNHNNYEKECSNVNDDDCQNIDNDDCQNINNDDCKNIDNDGCQNINNNNCKNERKDNYQNIREDDCQNVDNDDCQNVDNDDCQNVDNDDCQDDDECQDDSDEEELLTVKKINKLIDSKLKSIVKEKNKYKNENKILIERNNVLKNDLINFIELEILNRNMMIENTKNKLDILQNAIVREMDMQKMCVNQLSSFLKNLK